MASLTSFAINSGGKDIYPQWFNAIKNNNLGKVKELIDKVNVNFNFGGNVPIILASAFGYANIVKLLLEVPGIDVNAQDKSGQTALIASVYYHQDHIAQILLKAPLLNINAQDAHGHTALMDAVERENKELIELLLDAGADLYIKNKDGKTVLDMVTEKFKPTLERLINKSKRPTPEEMQEWFLAATHGNVDILQKLIAKVDVNAKDITDKTALMWAAQKGYENIVKILLDSRRIKINEQDSSGMNALMYACQYHHESIVKLLLQQPGISVNTQTKKGDTALILAAFLGYSDIVKMLLTVSGININAQNKDGITALMNALSHKEVLKLLLDAGADPNLKNKDGDTFMDLADEEIKPALQAMINEAQMKLLSDKIDWFAAALSGDINKIKKLVGKVDINLQDKDGYTALMIAVWKNHENIVKLLLSTPGINVNITNNEGKTALMRAASWTHENLVKLLLQVPNININAQDKHGITALLEAVLEENESIVKMLLNAGSDPDIRDKHGKTVIDDASEKFRPILERAIQDAKIKKINLISRLSAELYQLSRSS